jgi:ribosomal protein S18 acetylase RimI-like enzyme
MVAIHKLIFETTEDLKTKMGTKPKLLILIAMDNNKVIGYKIGYEQDSQTFYSWLGGVDPDYRTHGIASMLMEKQHHYLKEKGYRVVRTKTMNKWRHMLLLNIKYGFDVIDTYTDEKGLHKIILEKKLLTNE